MVSNFQLRPQRTGQDMTNADHAREAVRFFIESLNAQDHEQHANALNYPHIRLANGHFARLESADQFAQISAANESRLRAEGWDHTVVRSLEIIQEGVDKVHIAITNDRCGADGTVYKSFETFWIATCVEGHWGIQFRSSYLR